MKPFKSQRSIVLLVGIFLITSLILSGCASKAKSIKVGAAQFRAESDAAITKIDDLRKKEVASAPLPPELASKVFISRVKGSKGMITRKQLRSFVDPVQLQTPKSEAQWQAFIQKMRQQYAAFEAAFTSLEKGSLLATPNVKQMIPILDKLIAQMTAFAEFFQRAPAEFIAERDQIAAEIRQVRDAQPFNEASELKLKDLQRRLQDVSAAEKQITQEACAQALKAAETGIQLRQLLIDYDKLSVDDINEGLSQAFKLAAGIPGLDVPKLQAKTDELMGTINNDADLKESFDTAFAELHARTK